MSRRAALETLVACAFLALALLVTAPMLRNMRRWGVHDWAQFNAYYGVPRQAIVEYGELPGWNPYYYGGNVQWGHPHDPTLSPLFVPVLIFGEVVGSKISLILVLAAGMYCMWLLAREFSISRPGCFFAATVWGLNGWHAYHFAVGHCSHWTSLFQPLAVLFFLRARHKPAWAAAAGAVIAGMYLSGGPYPFVFASILLAVLSLFLAGAENSLRPLKAMSLSLLFAAGFSMVKLLSTLEYMFLAIGSEPDFSGTPLWVVWRALFDARMPMRPGYEGLPWGRWEYAAFIGYLPAALFLVGAAARRAAAWPWVATAAVFFVASLGSVSPVDFFALFTVLPGLSGMHVFFRFIMHVIMVVSLVGAMGIDFIRERLRQTSIASAALPVAGLLAALAAGNLVWMYYNRPVPLYSLVSFIPAGLITDKAPEEAAELLEGHASLRPGAAPYVPVTYPQTLIVYRAFLEGERLGWGYDVSYLPRAALMPEDPGYRGEVFFLDPSSPGTLEMEATLSRYSVTYSSESDGVVVLNQNYHPGWRVSGAAEQVKNVRGLVTAGVPAGSGRLIFTYAPTSRVAGAVVTLATILAAVWVSRRPEDRPAGKPRRRRGKAGKKTSRRH